MTAPECKYLDPEGGLVVGEHDYDEDTCVICGDQREALCDSDDDNESYSIPCSRCGKPTTWDETYGDLCFRCCRADNE